MNCSFSPYIITSSDFESSPFIDFQKPRRIAVITSCETMSTLPCPNASVLHVINECPDGCSIVWYECNDILGRLYTIIPTPCGVTISSFDNGLLRVGDCDASQYGSEFFCYGKIYTSAGTFKGNPNEVSFEFDGHTFNVSGILGECGELYSCNECVPDIETFATLPTAPLDISSPTNEGTLKELEETGVKTQIIPSESITEWEIPSNWTQEGRETICNSEINVTAWDGASELSVCESNNNPSIVTLPSGHTIIAYENRTPEKDQEGISKISVSILSSSVEQNVRYYRKLSRGTLLNNPEIQGIGTFIIYDEIFINVSSNGVPRGDDNGLKIGFLSGPLMGRVFTITETFRTLSVDNTRKILQRTFKFNIGSSIEFPDKNNIYDVQWFLLSPSAGDANLPDTDNTVATLTLPYHTFNGVAVPVAYPSIAVADNNLMSGSEMNIYIAYQAFEDKEWRVYLREIVLGNDTEVSPRYLAPYLFAEDPYMTSEDPYGTLTVNYKPEDLWVIGTGDNSFVTRVLYHMEKEFSIVGSDNLQSSKQNNVDFMFVINHSGSMQRNLDNIRLAIPTLAQNFIDKGLDVRFGFVGYGRSDIDPKPTRFDECGTGHKIFNGLQAQNPCCTNDPAAIPESGGFTRNATVLSDALGCWCAPSGGKDNAFAAIQYAILDPEFTWRTNAQKYIFLVTDSFNPSTPQGCSYLDIKENALQVMLDNDVILIGALCLPGDDNCDLSTSYLDLAEKTGWTGGNFSANSSNYGDIFTKISEIIKTSASIKKRRVVERSKDGTNPTYLKSAELIVTYDGDLSDLWTFDKSSLEFSSSALPVANEINGGISNESFPFPLTTLKVYNINAVHIQGNSSRWTSFNGTDPLIIDYPDVGFRQSLSNEPILISTNSTRPKVLINNRNHVIIAYENHLDGSPQIEIQGTGDFHQNSITGPKGARISRFLTISDFSYSHSITLPGEGLNQLCDFVVDNSDITHVVWQSNRNGYWEIYYANSFNLFEPVRITESKSKSTHPSIDIDQNGSIFIVYQDNRFGPFEIMLASKDEERVMPLLEQDAYFASLRNNYTHYTNILPVMLDNPSSSVAGSGIFWATKVGSDIGNDYENYMYQIDPSTGATGSGNDFGTSEVNYIAFSKSLVYGINLSGDLYKIGTIEVDESILFNLTLVGRIPLDSSEIPSDMNFDNFGRLWVLIHNNNTNSLKLMYVNISDASLISQETIYAGLTTSNESSLSITSDNVFYVISKRGNHQLSYSSYPFLEDDIATFSFTDIAPINTTFESITVDHNDVLYGVDTSNNLYTIDKISGAIVFQTSLTVADSGEYGETPINVTSGLAFQITDTIALGTGKYFHVFIEFYTNIELEGDPFISVDSRNNLESFINKELIDEYGTPRMSAAGLFIESDALVSVFFDATHFSPGFSKLAQPYGFEANQTYFPKVYSINSDGNLTLSGVPQNNSFSCNKCSRFGNNNFNISDCSYSFVASHTEPDTQYFNFQVDFYADTGKRHLVRRFMASPDHEDLQYFEVNNTAASNMWNDLGLPIAANEKSFIQVYPQLDPQAGFLCGVDYTVQVNQCFDKSTRCSDFTIIEPLWWNAVLIEDDSEVAVVLGNNDMLGVSIAGFNENLVVAWRANDNTLRYAIYDGNNWNPDVIDVNCVHLEVIIANNQPAIVYIKQEGNNFTKLTRWFNGTTWSQVPNMTFSVTDSLIGPPSIAENNGQLVDAAVVSDTSLISQTLNGIDTVLEESSGRFCSLANINGTIYLLFITNNLELAFRTFNGSIWTSKEIIDSGVVEGKPAIAEVNGQPAVAYLKQDGTNTVLIYRRFNGNSWEVNSPDIGIRTLSKHVAMTVVNNNPVIVYAVITDNGSDIRATRLFSGTFVDSFVTSTTVSIPALDATLFRGEAALIISSNPFSVYFFVKEPESSIENLNPRFLCDCSSKIFSNRLTHLSEISRWESSAQGFADTRVTDSQQNSMLPVIKTRISDTAVILWEDHAPTDNCPNPPCIRAATFRNIVQDQLMGSGTQSWFDFDFGIQGKQPSIDLDLYNRINIAYERLKPSNIETGFFGKNVSSEELPENEVFTKICDFKTEDKGVQLQETCDISSLEANVITFDPFISHQIVKRIRVKDEFVKYYTYNASGTLTPIVSNCDIVLHIHGTPEIVAIRLRNENQSKFGPWCPWSPQISDFVMEKQHKISGGTGIKEICIQAMTYSGITTEFCLPIVADYETIIFETRFYAATVNPEEFINFTINDNDLTLLPLSGGVSIANLAPQKNNTILETTTILVEIIPDQDPIVPIINFDVIQQGSNDQFGLPSSRGKNNKGKLVYRGIFEIKKEDKVSNIDGLARISPAFPNSCDEDTETSAATFRRDSFNQIGKMIEVENDLSDPLKEFRQEISGKVGVTIDIRGTEDPYFIFGDPNYSLQESNSERKGLPINKSIIVGNENTSGS